MNIQIDNLKNFVSANKNKITKIAIPIVIVGIGLYSIGGSKKIVHKNIDEIFQISTEIREYYVGKPDYWKLSTAEVIDNGMISAKFINNNHIVLTGGNEVFIGKGVNASPVMPLSQSYDIVIKNLNKADCMFFVEYNLDENKLVTLQSITINNINGDSVYEWGGINSLPAKKYSSKAYCIDSENTIVWTIK